MTERLTVLLYDHVIGHLERERDGALPTFNYDHDYLESGRTPLSLRLPISAVKYPAAKVEPYLRGLLPENDATRHRWARDLATGPDDIFAMLAEMGWDCPGAVQFCRPVEIDQLLSRGGEHVAASSSELADRLRELTERPASWTMPDEHWSLGGQQEKFALALLDGQWYTAHGSAATTHIVKPGIRALLHQAVVEHVTMQAAAALGVGVASTELVAFDDQWAIVVERFDRVIDGRTVARLHQEDFAQALGRLPAQKYESNRGPTLRDLTGLVRRETTDPDDSLRALADYVAVNLVAGAPDGHAKNISLLLLPDGRRWVAPLYDLATGLSYDARRVERTVAQSIGGERTFSRIRRREWEKAAATLGFDPEVLTRRVAILAEDYPTAFDNALADVQHVPGADQVAGRTVEPLREHCARLLDQLA